MLYHIACKIPFADHDRDGGLIFIVDRICFDFLCRDKSGLGEKIKCGKYAASCITCNFSGIFTVGVLKTISVFEVTSKDYKPGEITCMI